MALAFDWFYAPNELTLGGFTGIAQVINFFAAALPVGITVIVLNAPLFLMSLKRFGKHVLLQSFFAVAVNSLFIDLINALYTFQPMDKLLGCLYGGVLVGISLGWLLREETTTGGTELGAWLMKAKIPGLSIGKLCLAIDLTIIVLYAVVFHSLENALYGGIALYISTYVMDMVVYGGIAAKLAYIISSEQEKISAELLARDVGVTRLTAEGAYTRNDKPVLLCAVRRREIVAVKRIVNEIDPAAFFIVCDAREVLGEGFSEYKPDGL
ncbi:YitT family protein [Oscillibacter valericigenes]|nr:YitT family protein [Oscillibacter valericigenes]